MRTKQGGVWIKETLLMYGVFNGEGLKICNFFEGTIWMSPFRVASDHYVTIGPVVVSQ